MRRLLVQKQSLQIAQIAFCNYIDYFCYFHCQLYKDFSTTGFYVILIYLNKFHSFLLGSNPFPFLISSYKMTAIKESRFLSNKIQVIICMKK